MIGAKEGIYFRQKFADFFVLAAKFSKKIFQIEENKLLLLIPASGCFNDYPMRPFILELILTL